MQTNYIKYIELENFRNFKNKVSFNLAPITLLTGPNSSGKSSLTKAIELIKSSSLENNGLNELSFINGNHNLGFFENILNRDSSKNEAVFVFEFPLPSLFEHFFVELKYKPDPNNRDFGSLSQLRIYNQETDLILLKRSHGDEKGYGVGKINFPYILDRLTQIKQSLSRNQSPYKSIFFSKKEPSILFFDPKNTSYLDYFFENDFEPSQRLKEIQTTDLIEEIDQLSFTERERIRKNIEKRWKEGSVLEDHRPYSPTELIWSIDKCLYDFLKDLSLVDDGYSGVYLQVTSSLYYNRSDKKEKKNTATALSMYLVEEIIQNDIIRGLDKFLDKLMRCNSIKSMKSLPERVYSANSELYKLLTNFWTKELYESQSNPSFVNPSLAFFGIGNKLTIEWKQGTISEVFIETNTGKFLLADLGFGITQLLTIILKIDDIGRNKGMVFREANELHNPSVLMLENPETNLYPRLQAKLAEYIVHAAETFNIQFIIETHSEGLIRAFQKLVIKKKIQPYHAKIYFFNDPTSPNYEKKVVKEIEFLRNGELSQPIGDGFLD